MEAQTFIQKLIEQAPVVGVLLYLIVQNAKRLDQIVDKCSTQMEALTNRLLDIQDKQK